MRYHGRTKFAKGSGDAHNDDSSAGYRAVRGGVFRRDGALGRVRGGGEPRFAVDGLGHGGLRTGAAPTPGSASLRGYRRARGGFSRFGPCEGERSPRGARVHLGHGLGELLPGGYRGGNVPGAAHRSVWRPAPAAAGPRRAANHRPAEGLRQSRAFLPRDAHPARPRPRHCLCPPGGPRGGARRAWPDGYAGSLPRVGAGKGGVARVRDDRCAGRDGFCDRGGFPRQACCCFSWLRSRRAADGSCCHRCAADGSCCHRRDAGEFRDRWRSRRCSRAGCCWRLCGRSR